MDSIKVVFFDLFFTLIIPAYEENVEDNEYSELSISREEWELMAEDEQLYFERATGNAKDSVDIIRKIFIKNGIDKNESVMKKIAEKRMKRFQRSLSNVENSIIETLEYLFKNNKRMCLISNADIIDKDGWATSPINKYFEEAIFSCDVGALKPDRRIYEIALNKMRVSPREAVFIGDGGSEELRGAKESGMQTILVTHFTNGLGSERSLEYADVVVDNFEDIAKHIV
jgi:putative hydrolase of the HAD superfamily